jgi:hypothetical protein
MSEPGGLEKRMRAAILVALFVVVVVAPMVGVYALSPLLFVGGLDPYPLAVTLGVMLAEAIAVAALFFLVFRSKR